MMANLTHKPIFPNPSQIIIVLYSRIIEFLTEKTFQISLETTIHDKNNRKLSKKNITCTVRNTVNYRPYFEIKSKNKLGLLFWCWLCGALEPYNIETSISDSQTNQKSSVLK